MKIKYSLLWLVFGFNHAFAQVKPDVSLLPVHLQYTNSTKPLVIFITGDGGWNSFSTKLSDGLSKNGFPVIALDSKKYFWDKKTPVQFGKDMQLILDEYLNKWGKSSFSIIGYSFGADVAAFLPANLSVSSSAKLNSLVLLSPGYSTAFEVKLMGMLNSGGDSNQERYKIMPEINRFKKPVYCVFGADEDNDFKDGLKEADKIHKIIIPGSHHYNDDISVVTKAVAKVL